jgi:hypothetical protein
MAPPPPARFAHQRARVLRKVILRTNESLDSAPCGSLKPGTRVLVLEESFTGGRMLVGAAYADGVEPLGWVTRERQGEALLSDTEAPDVPGLELNCSSCRKPWSGSTSRFTSPRPTPSQGSLATRIAKRRQESQERRRSCADSSSSSSESTAAAAHMDARKRQELGGLWTSTKLRNAAETHSARAASSANFDNIASILGNVNDLGKRFGGQLDKNNDGIVTKFEFSAGVRAMLDDERKRRRKTTRASEDNRNESSLEQANRRQTEHEEIDELFDKVRCPR